MAHAVADRAGDWAEKKRGGGQREADGTAFRLIGVSLSQLSQAHPEDEAQSLDPDYTRRAKAETAMDTLRAKFGRAAVEQGRVFRGKRAEDDED